MCTCTRVDHNLCNPHELLAGLTVLMTWHTCKSLLNTSGRAVEQLAGCLAKQAKVSSRGQSTIAMPIPALSCLMNI